MRCQHAGAFAGNVTSAIRAVPITMLPKRWEASLSERAKLPRGPSCPPLDAARQQRPTKIGSHFAPRIGHQRATRLGQRRESGH